MTRTIIATAFAASLMASAASAATFTTWGPVNPDGSFSGNFGNTGVIGDADGNFTDVFDFTLPTGMSSFSVNSTFSSSSANNINFTTVQFNGQDFTIGDAGQNEFRYLNDVNVTLNGQQHLLVSGHTGGTGSYDGVISFTPTATGAVPEPGAWALMILGFGGAGALIRRRNPAAAAA